eukprot:CAMPEP_0113586730 /NCGR_PEP_ID=MMETSP0015_2-20120614/34462_1 /TAXON_ID=2838 /ORGANISM="Odontella" /LENGTH=86 /DNA_ID=CAMNT_0000492205 /DNA_START=370 /DNA_END=626 /DNA_ORIENTATION=+ /assembly_acc=CAM_ASM_000160
MSFPVSVFIPTCTTPKDPAPIWFPRVHLPLRTRWAEVCLRETGARRFAGQAERSTADALRQDVVDSPAFSLDSLGASELNENAPVA